MRRYCERREFGEREIVPVLVLESNMTGAADQRSTHSVAGTTTSYKSYRSYRSYPSHHP
jgi:hypothetical protein